MSSINIYSKIVYLPPMGTIEIYPEAQNLSKYFDEILLDDSTDVFSLNLFLKYLVARDSYGKRVRAKIELKQRNGAIFNEAPVEHKAYVGLQSDYDFENATRVHSPYSKICKILDLASVSLVDTEEGRVVVYEVETGEQVDGQAPISIVIPVLQHTESNYSNPMTLIAS